MLNTGIFPDTLKIAKVVLFNKKGDDELFTNYRPISLLPSVSKIFERVIFNQSILYFDRCKLLYKSFYGFRKNYWITEFAALEFIDKIIHSMDNGYMPVGIFMDLPKAFDTIDHNILVINLEFYEVKGFSNKLLKNYLTNRQQYVSLEDKNSNLLEIKTGVPQGSILGPLLFLIYVNDMVKCSDTLFFILFADDTTLIVDLDVYDQTIINRELKKLSLWLKLNKLSLNVNKSKCIVFRQPQKTVEIPEFKIADNNIEVVDNFCISCLNIDKT